MKGETMQAEGQMERGYTLMDERPRNPGLYFDATQPAEYLTAEYHAKIQAICEGCEWRFSCPDRGYVDAVDVCLVLQDAL